MPPSAERTVVVSAYSGTDNLGDELLLQALLRRLPPFVRPVVISVDPATTTERHGVEAVAERDLRGLARLLRTADVLILGPGGLLQDETSMWSLPRHLAKAVLARRLGVAVVGFGLGAGPLDTRLGRTLVARVLRDVPLVVRDRSSARVLESVGLEAQVTADLVFGLPPPEVGEEEVVVACLRAFGGRGGLVPARLTDRRDPRRSVRAAGLAAGLDALCRDTGWPLRLVALEGERDDAFHREVASSVSVEVELRRPGLPDLLDEVAAGRLVVASRYHAGVAALLSARPAVLVGYAPKVAALAAQADSPSVIGVPDDPTGWAALAVAGSRALEARGAAEAARERLVRAESVNLPLLRDLLAGPRA